MKRTIVKVKEDICNGYGSCVKAFVKSSVRIFTSFGFTFGCRLFSFCQWGIS